ncbi:PqqD family peptide modification chaperone [Azoarcus communis]|uniref:PqqD family peptide modification chaperone n=1 Tax=Parazoarcus communis TaxID=41977 RepID=UPI00145970D6|nr:PqqD family peptide modification chaperone [Parazoarcus communis]NMG48066.1 PqqD family peptide modification chaperone [Parazoarcus communis]
MASSLFSASWYRIAALRPKLRVQARIVRHLYRGERWHVLQDMGSGRFLRLDPTAYRIVALMDGVRTVDEIWQIACAELADAAPTQDEVLGLLAQLHQANVLLTDRPPDFQELDERRKRSRRMRLKQYIGNPLSIRVPLLDPDRFLTRLVSLIPAGFGPWLLPLWMMLVGSGVFVAITHWSELTGDLTARVFTAENMLLLWLAFPLLKGIHELGHGLAIKAFGGSCREMGLMFLLFVPIPYVDASSATAFESKLRRMVVGLAGMMIELGVAALAIWLWTWASPGVGKAFLHQIVVLASITTLMFNANPLLRFDGYYVLADWLEIPNLGQKANRYFGHQLLRHLFRVGDRLTPLRLTPREAPWLLFYSVGSFIYRMFVAVLIVMTVAAHYFFIGVLLAAWAVYTMLLAPLGRQLRFLFSDAILDGHRGRAVGLSVALTGGLLALLTLVPAPSWTHTEGVIWMSEQARVRAPLPCFAAEVLVAPGSRVEQGEPLLRCDDPELDARRRQIAARVAELQARLALAATEGRVQTGIVSAELDYFRGLLSDIDTRFALMTMRSPHAGVFVMDAPGDYPGRYLERGDVLGYVLDPAAFSLIAVVPQGEVDLVRRRTVAVELRSVDRIEQRLPASIVREVPAATRDLPSLALSLQGGGRIGLDPTDSGQSPRALVPLFQFEIRFSGPSIPQTLGNRVHVRFVHAAEPLASQWYRSVRQVFLKRFAV